MAVQGLAAEWAKVVAAGVAALALVAGAWAQDKADKQAAAPYVPWTTVGDAPGLTPADLDLQLALEKEVDFSFEKAPLREVVDFFRQVTQRNMILLDEPRGEHSERLVSMTVTRIPLKNALNLILGDSLTCLVHNGAIVIATRESVRRLQPRVTRAYDVRDILEDATPRMSSKGLVACVMEAAKPWEAVSVRIVDGDRDDDDDDEDDNIDKPVPPKAGPPPPPRAEQPPAKPAPPRSVWPLLPEGSDFVFLWGRGRLLVRAPEEIHRKVATVLEGLRPGPRIVLDAFLVAGDLAKVEAILGQDIRAGRRLNALEWNKLRALATAETGGFSAASRACLADTPLLFYLGGSVIEARISVGDDGRAAFVRVEAHEHSQTAQALQCGQLTVLAANAEAGAWRLLLARVIPAEP